jgi:hypothetical protein
MLGARQCVSFFKGLSSWSGFGLYMRLLFMFLAENNFSRTGAAIFICLSKRADIIFLLRPRLAFFHSTLGQIST